VSTSKEPDDGRMLAEGCYMNFMKHYLVEIIFTKQHAEIYFCQASKTSGSNYMISTNDS
jgi:hypothetical protein